MAKKQFRTESKRMLDLMINSVYTNREIFLRELISNASDAIDKLYFRSLTDDSVGMTRGDFAVNISIDKESRTLTVSDNGIGMTREELDDNLGTIAKSGSKAFSEENADAKGDIDIIGQFGVGFYSAFMVASKLEVVSRAFGSDEAFCWKSEGADGYSITPASRDTAGTDIIITVKTSEGEDSFEEFLDINRISALVKKYSDYIRYPIKALMTKSRLKDGSEDEYEDYDELCTLNTMVPLWKRAKSEIKPEEYSEFYKTEFSDYTDPLKVIHQKAEGAVMYDALLFIPSKADYNYYSKNYEKGLRLYTSGVKIMEKCPELLPDCFSFVKGIVDSEDLSLNISRELLQQDRQLKFIANALEKKIKNELKSMLEKERDEYEKLWNSFGLQLKFALYSSFGQLRELLEELLMFKRASDSKLCTLAEYVAAMPEGQQYIYYAAGDSDERLVNLPQAEPVREKGYDILLLTDNVDEFLMNILFMYEEKQFRSIMNGDLGLESEEEKSEKEEKEKSSKELLDYMCDSLDGKVTEVALSSRLKSHPVCISSKGGISLEMEKILDSMPAGEQTPKAQRVLELNASHPVFEKLTALWDTDKERVKEYAQLLYNQALLIEGLPVEDPVEFSNAVCKLMSE